MQNVNLNLIPGSVLPVINVSQYDVGRQFTLTVYEGAVAYSLTGKGVEIRGTKPDGNGFAYDSTDGAVSVSNNVVTITTLEQMTPCGGQVMCELRITSGSTVLGTLNFILDCEPSALSDDTPISDTDIPAIERDMQDQVDRAEDAADAAEAAVAHYPYIDAVSKHWMVWDVQNETWTDTGIVAEGTSGDYAPLTNKPQINSVTLTGNKTAADLSLAPDAVMTGATAGTAGAKGLVPAPAAGDESKFLRGDGTWAAGGGTSVPSGGTTNQVLAKNSNTDGDTKWMDVPSVAEVAAVRDNGAVNVFKNTLTSQVIAGITIVVNSDGTYTFNTDANGATISFFLDIGDVSEMQVGKSYKLTGRPAGLGSSTYMCISGYANETTDSGNGSDPFTVVNGMLTEKARIHVQQGQVFTNTVFKPMISPAALNLSYSDYQPYAMTNRELTVGFEPVDISDTITIGALFDGNAASSYVYAYKIGKMYYISFGQKVKTAFNAGTPALLFSFSTIDYKKINLWNPGIHIGSNLAIKGIAFEYVPWSEGGISVILQNNAIVDDYVMGQCFFCIP